ncbi:hypothetical protein SAMN05444349_1175 [Bacteroides faecichinchillae]|uniref:YD repeat-containing protein n=1 Tax=Bacteroides faecichinchillae TaxID=871325 RepID=A0A1M5AZD2_9BACE|nr:hypothetical protein SAMN05444349_1175 [Bacteroides faecichinchillae]
MKWKAGTETIFRGYKFTYDGLSRLKNAVYGEGATLVSNLNRFNEQVTGYDKQGNILGLSRYGLRASQAALPSPPITATTRSMKMEY